MRILALDGDSVFRRNWEAAEGRELSAALMRTIDSVNRARDDFDRVVIAWDGGPSFRKARVPEYKASRTDPGAPYREQRQRCIERLQAEGCATIIGPEIEVDGARGFAEADDVLAWLAAEYSTIATADDLLRLVSGDGDAEALVRESPLIDVFKPGARTEEALWTAKTVRAKRGVEPAEIPEWKALCGDKDEVPGFDGIGDKCAAMLIRLFSTAINATIKAPDDESIPPKDLNKKQRESLRSGGAEHAAKSLWLATLRPHLPLDYAAIVLAEPKRSAITSDDSNPGLNDTQGHVPPKVRPAEVVHISQARAIEKRELDPYALEPQTAGEAWKMAKHLAESRIYPKLASQEAVFAAIVDARSRRMPVGVALRNAYTVKGQLGWSAAYIAGCVLASGLAEYFELVPEECDEKRATIRFKRAGRPAGKHVYTIEDARREGLIVEGTRWVKDPKGMLRAAALRTGARAYFFDVASGTYMPDELRGRSSDDDDEAANV